MKKRRSHPSAAPPSTDRGAGATELVWIALPLTAFERAIVAELVRRGPYRGLEDVVVAGFWQLAKQFDIPVNAFTLGRGK